MRKRITALVCASTALLVCSNALAKEAPVELAKCTANLGTIAVVEGDTQGWLKYNLGSPRELLAAMANESGCFTPHNPASGASANYLMNVIAGDAEEVDKGMEMAKGAAVEGLVRSGAAGQLLGRVPMGGAMLGMLGGLGGKKKTVAAGIRVISPANGMTLVSGSGTVKKSTLTFGGVGGWAQG
ncbi:MAG: SH3 domain-containing protein, partial [Sphingorhabdus sp.]